MTPSKDATAVDPETLDTLKAVETIKEGESIFILTPEEERLGSLMLRPTRDGHDAFANFLIAAARQSDCAALSEEVQMGSMMWRAMHEPLAGETSPQDNARVLSVIDDLFGAMTSES